jgi:hypothetical protein
MPTRDAPIRKAAAAGVAGNEVNVHEQVIRGLGVSTETRLDALAGVGQFARVWPGRAQFNDYNRLAWIVNALARSLPLVTLADIPFSVMWQPAPDQWDAKVMRLPMSTLRGILNGTSAWDVRLELTNARESDGETLVQTFTALADDVQMIFNELGIPLRRTTFFDLIPARGGQQLSGFYYSLDDLRRVAAENGVPMLERGLPGEPVRQEYTAFAVAPTSFDNLQLTGESVNLSTQSQVGSGLVDPTLRRVAVVSTGDIERNGGFVSSRSGFTLNDDWSTGNIDDTFPSVVREWDYIDLRG